MKALISLLFVIASVFLFSSCEDRDPSLLKIYIRDANKNIISGMDVRIVALVANYPAHNDKANTNQAGYALFNLDDYFETNFEPKEAKVADFRVYVQRGSGLELKGDVRVRGYQTTEETFILED